MRRLIAAASFVLAAACTDPRARPVSPVVEISFAPSYQLKSPGQVQASLYMFDADGLESVNISVLSADSVLQGDSLIGLTGDTQITRPILWDVPPGLGSGTQVTLVAKAKAITGFSTADTSLIYVQ